MKKSEQLHLRRSGQRSNWINKPMLAHHLTPWLIDEASLTKRLQQRYQDFNVQLLQVTHASVLEDERALIGVRANQRAFVREVFLLGKGQPVVFAHSVMALKQLRGRWAGLTTLGKQPLGATLFANPNIKRTLLHYRQLMPNNPLYQKAAQYLFKTGQVDIQGGLWARRSVFSLKGHQHAMRIVVTEVFLPSLLKADRLKRKAISEQ